MKVFTSEDGCHGLFVGGGTCEIKHFILGI